MRTSLGLLAALLTGLMVLGPAACKDRQASALPYRMVVAPGADPSRLPVSVAATDQVEIGRGGELRITRGAGTRPAGTVQIAGAPRAYQDIAGVRRIINARFEITAEGHVQLAVGPYDRSQPLVIHSDKL